MKTIAVGDDLQAQVDDDMHEMLSSRSWYPSFRGSKKNPRIYAFSNTRDLGVITMHRLIIGAIDRRLIDHVDGNGLNNQKHNLRVASASQNIANSRKREIASSKFKGVGWHKSAQKWEAYICPNRHKIHLGLFEIEEQAAVAYDRAARYHFGNFARLNFSA